MANLPTVLLPISGRELPRGQRWMDSADVDEARSDPGMDRVAYLEWERDEATSPAFEDLVYEVLDGEWDDLELVVRHEPEADVVVWVNGVPLEVWLTTATLEQRDPDVELGLLDGGDTPGDEAAERRAAARRRWMALNDDLLWGNSRYGRRSQSRMRWRRRAWERSASVRAATRAVRAARPEPVLVWEDWPVVWIAR